MTDTKEIEEKVRRMTVDELIAHRNGAKNINRIISTIGILFLFLSLMYPNIYLILVSFIIVYFASNLGVGVDQVIKILDKQLDSKR